MAPKLNVTLLSVLVLALLLLPAKSLTLLRARLAITVPEAVMPVMGTVQVMLSDVVGMPATAPGAVPVIVMSAAVNVVGLIGSENTTVNKTGLALAGSSCATSWLIVTLGCTLSNTTELSVLVLGPF